MSRPVFFAILCLLATTSARADGAPEEPAYEAKVLEQPDATRLDVARLPREALPPDRDVYARGLFVEAELGAIGFVGDLGDVASVGPRLALGLGYEFADWIALTLSLEGSLHETHNRPPPNRTAFEMAGARAGLRFSVPIGVQTALWAAATAGAVWTGGDVLKALGFKDAIGLGPCYGGELGFDFHVRGLHHSLGALVGGRAYPTLSRGDLTVGAYGSLYLRYVF